MDKNDKFWAFIPARSRSKSIKNKNLLKLKNKSLMAHAVISALSRKIIQKVVVSSDSKKYLNIAAKYGCNLMHKRSKKFAKDYTTDLEVFRDFLNFLKKEKINPPDYFIHLRPTTPIRDTKILQKGVNFFIKKNKNYTSMRSVSLMSNTSYKTMRIIKGKLCSIINKDFNLDKYNGPRDLFPETFLPNGYIDIVKTSNIKENIFHGKKVLPYIIYDFNSDIDSIEDYEYVKFKLKKKNDKNNC